MKGRSAIAARLAEISALDPLASTRELDQLAARPLPSLPFAEAIADHLIESQRASDQITAFENALFEHLITLAPVAEAQLLRVVYRASSRSVVTAALDFERHLRDEQPVISHRLEIDFVGTEAEALFGLVLEDAMIRGVRFSEPEWDRLVSGSQAARNGAVRLVWTAHCAGNDIHFRLTPEGERRGADDELFEPDAIDSIRLEHTFDFDESEVSRWGKIFADYDIVTLFSQFDRTLATPPDSWKERDAVPIHRGAALDTTFRHFVRSGWRPRRKGSRAYFDRDFAGGVVATVSWHASGAKVHLIELYFATESGQPLYLGDTPQIAYSEALLTLSELGVASA